MSAVEVLKAALAARTVLGFDGYNLLLVAAAPPPAALLSLLLQDKASIVDLLWRGSDGWPAEDRQVFFDERLVVASSRSPAARLSPGAPSPEGGP